MELNPAISRTYIVIHCLGRLCYRPRLPTRQHGFFFGARLLSNRANSLFDGFGCVYRPTRHILIRDDYSVSSVHFFLGKSVPVGLTACGLFLRTQDLRAATEKPIVDTARLDRWPDFSY